MDYQNVKEKFVEDVKRALNRNGIEDAEIVINHVEKILFSGSYKF